ncbi:MAG TPA: hypothetical protein PKX01_16390, partial [Rhodocyclaceae bacterium]|nr:hypothetical protein [Rhodocyclaceae bacterium]
MDTGRLSELLLRHPKHALPPMAETIADFIVRFLTQKRPFSVCFVIDDIPNDRYISPSYRISGKAS